MVKGQFPEFTRFSFAICYVFVFYSSSMNPYHIRRLLITLDVNGLVKIIDRINKTVDNGIWKVMNGEWPAMEKYFDVFLRTTIASEKVWNNLGITFLKIL